jgi:hypothetical protein
LLISRIRLRHLSPPPTSISKYLSPTLYPLIPETPVFPSDLQLRSRTFLQLQQTTSQIPESLLYIITLVKLVNTPQQLQ